MLWEHVVKKKKKKSPIRETKHFLIDADSSTITINILLVRQYLSKKIFFFYRPYKLTPVLSKSCQIRDHFFPLIFPNDFENVKCLDIGPHEVGAKRSLSGVNKWKKIMQLKIFFLSQLFHTLHEQTFSNLIPFFQLLFPNYSRNLTSLDIGV